MNVEHCHAVIVVFAMEGCGACEDYKPRLETEIQRWQANGAPLVFARPGMTFEARHVPIILLDAQSSNAQIQAWADEFKVEGLPTTVLCRRGAPPQILVGAIDDRQIYDLLASATR